PFIPGSEVAGRVGAVGSNVRGYKLGDRVAAFCRLGGYAEQVAVDVSQVQPLTGAIDDVSAAAMPVAYGTAYHGLVDLARVQPTDVLLVLGAAGGVGLTAVEIG